MIRKAAVMLIVFFAFGSKLYAAPAYGTHMPDKAGWTWGMEYNYLKDRGLESGQGGTNGSRIFITGSYGVFEWLSFDGKIGAGNVGWNNAAAGDIDFNTGFSGAYGFRVRLYEGLESGVKIVSGFQHISVHPLPKNYEGHRYDVIIDDWQCSAVISKDINKFVPYMGLRYGTLDFIKWVDEHDRKRTKSGDNLGVITGMDFWIDKRTRVNIEFSFLDGEEAVLGFSRDF